MNPNELRQKLVDLIARWENEVVEFKEAKKDYDTTKIGQYFSALANEANLRGLEKAWLVFGVNDETRSATGTQYRTNNLQDIYHQVTTMTSSTFRHIHELDYKGKRVILFEIPAAPQGMPIASNGHYYARAGESLTGLPIDKLETIRGQTLESDWSAQEATGATIDDFDETALKKAMDSFILKNANRIPEEEIRGWKISDFLDKAKITRKGKITRAAILLLGKPESAHLLNPHPAEITWKLDEEQKAYEHFHTPFLLTTTQIYQKIRNYQIRLLPHNALSPMEISKYDQKIVLEALHNCVAHQDYSKNARILVTEQHDKLIFENAGSFFEGSPDDYILDNKTPTSYRNTFLVEAMMSLNMIDKMGYGIHDMAKSQAKRFLPLSDYQQTGNKVLLTVYGSVVDEAYSQLLIQKTDLSLQDIFALDRVQKRLPISDDAMQRLRRENLIEGRKPNLHVSATIAAITGKKADYIHTRAQDDAHYAQLIQDYLRKFKQASRRDIDELIKKHLSQQMSDEQKTNKVSNILTNLRRAGRINNIGSRGKPIWKNAE